LEDTAPDHAPASIREALDKAVLDPAGRARPWPRSANERLRFAGRIAATLAILAIAGTGAYFYSASRSKAPSPGASAYPSGTVGPTSQASDTPGIDRLIREWHLVDTQMVDDQPGAFQGSRLSPVVALSSGGFVAFAFNPDLDQTFVFHSSDGTAWDHVGSLPTRHATVDSVADSGGLTVAVGYSYDAKADRAVPAAWTSIDLHVWNTAALPGPVNTGAMMVTAGPHGFLASGMELTQRSGLHFTLWMSADGTTWHTVAGPSLQAGAGVEDVSADSAGYAIRTAYAGAIKTWRSVDGDTWTEAWSRPADPAPTYFGMGRPVLKTSDGSYVTFGAGDSDDMVVWTSADLTTWTIAGQFTWLGMSSFAAISGGFISAGNCVADGTSCTKTMTGIWTSVDGLDWTLDPGTTPLVDGSGLIVNDVVSDGSHAIVVMRDNSDHLHLLVGTERK